MDSVLKLKGLLLPKKIVENADIQLTNNIVQTVSEEPTVCTIDELITDYQLDDAYYTDTPEDSVLLNTLILNYTSEPLINITEDNLLDMMLKLSHYNIGIVGNHNINIKYLKETKQYYQKIFTVSNNKLRLACLELYAKYIKHRFSESINELIIDNMYKMIIDGNEYFKIDIEENMLPQLRDMILPFKLYVSLMDDKIINPKLVIRRE